MPAVKSSEIRQRRQRLGLKLGQFTKLNGLNYKSYANVEAGCQVPSIELVYVIARALGCDAEELLADEDGRVAA